MIGRPLQKCKTSEIHYGEARVSRSLSSRAELTDLGSFYLLLNVVEGIWRVNSKADEDDVRIGV
jgi:hypothetical protein